ncbi:MAG: M48 family metallopeptidase [Campylobacteraceae bacterium]|jgi:Zn-dependent protease with chaperone function|nr:M48 family metallopeptidase [Campylobacteraceae bacterium]
MNFFERQERAKRKTTLLILLFCLGTIGVCTAVSYTVGVIFAHDSFDDFSYSPVFIFQTMPLEIFLILFFGSLTIIAAGSLIKISQLSANSGAFIARSLDGRLVAKNRADAKEAMLLNVVDEISIASGIPSPSVYILENDNTINAFAAGITYDDAVIGVTRGAVEFLTRDELQGVIAHEFSHIFNGDMKLNIRSIGILNGILFISLLGEIIMRSLSKSRNKKGGGGLLLIGLALYVIGYIGLFFGNLIKAAINREREYFADASAAQFTRYPTGLSNALKKIGFANSIISSAKADEFSHLYFSNGVKKFFSFSTHPPLEKRILALEPKWDGKFIVPKPIKVQTNRKKTEAKKETPKIITAAALLYEIDNIGTLNAESLQNAEHKIAQIPPALYTAVSDKIKVQLVVFALLLDADKAVRKEQQNIVKDNFLEAVNDFEEIQREISHEDLTLTLIQLGMPTLKTLTKEDYLKFKTTVERLIECDKVVSWFELNIKHLVLYPLDILFGLQKIPNEIYSSIFAVNFEVSALLSIITYGQLKDEKKALEAFEKIMHIADVSKARYIPFENISLNSLENVFAKIRQCKPLLRKKILEISIYALKSDGKFDAHDMLSVHALSSLLHLPI